MSDTTFEKLDALKESSGATAAIEELIESLRSRKEYNRLFDALLLRKKFEMGVPLIRPTSFDDVPEDQQQQFEEYYVEVAREIGDLYLQDGDIPQAWVYLRTIREPEKIAKALEDIDPRRDADEETEQLINIALYEGANPVKGLELMLSTHGTCNTITALDQQIQQLSPGDQQRATEMLANNIYEDLCHTIGQEVQQKLAMVPPGESLRELMTGRDWLFEEGNYHIDVSHLNAVVRFSRFLDAESPHLKKAIELSEYGSHLADQFQYPGDPPFDDFYPAHVQFFKALANENRDEAIGYFREKLDAEPNKEDQPVLAYVLVDLMIRCDRLNDALEVAGEYLRDVDDSAGFSFAQLCQDAGRIDLLREAAKARGDLVAYTAALLQEGSEPVTA